MTRKGRHVLALVVALALVLTTGAQVQPAAYDLGKRVSVIVSKVNPFDHRAEQTVERMGGTVGQRLDIVNGFEASVPEKGVAQLASVPGVRAVSPNGRVTVNGQYGEGSGVASAIYTDVTRASKAWGQGVNGSGVNVAIIDTGVDVSGDLAGKVVNAVDLSGENAPYSDSYGHGTFVAGVIAGSGAASSGAVKGMAPGSGIVSVKIAGRDGTTNLFRLLAALEYVALNKDAHGIRVVNLSLGSDSTQSYMIDPLNFAIERVWNSGIVVVVAAGNEGRITKPADDPLVVTVGAADDKTTLSRSDDVLASFSGVGPTLSNGIAKPEVVASGRSVVSSRAPGSLIEQSFPNASIGSNYFKGSGTSFSAAVVAGTAALVIQKQWSLNPNQVKHRLMANAKPLAAVSASAQGAGSVDAYNAVFSTALTEANQGVTPAYGGGSMQASSGSSCYRDANGACLGDAEVNAAAGFDAASFYGSQWAGSQWAGSQWAGSQWAGSQWAGSQWAGSQWAGSQWAGSQWAGSQWAGSQWAGSQWAGSQWAGSQWAGSQWAGSQWAGSQWAGSQWADFQWLGSHWS